MNYKDSFVYNLRQKVGDMRLSRKWKSESAPTDEEEVTSAEWVSFEKAIEKSTNSRRKSNASFFRPNVGNSNLSLSTITISP